MVEVACQERGAVGRRIAHRIRLRTIATASSRTQGTFAGEPGLAQTLECLYPRLYAGATGLCRAIRPPRIRRAVGGFERARHQARNRATARSARSDRGRRSQCSRAARALRPRSASIRGRSDPDVYLSRNYAPLDVRLKA